MELNLNDQELVRRQKMEELRSKGVDPFGQAFVRTANSQSLKAKYDSYLKEELLDMNVKASIAGRIMTKRGKGKLVLCIFKIDMESFKFIVEAILFQKMNMNSLKSRYR